MGRKFGLDLKIQVHEDWQTIIGNGIIIIIIIIIIPRHYFKQPLR
jgi:hypothetical protein